MSFAADVRKELSRQIPRARHCRIAELAALLYFCGTLRTEENGQVTLLFRTEQPFAYDTFLQLLKLLFRVFPEEEQFQETKERGNGPACRTQITDPETLQKIRSAVRLPDPQDDGAARPVTEWKILERMCCRRAFLRGAFLAAGTISDPNRSYSMEFLCRSKEQQGQMQLLLESMDIQAGVSSRGRWEPVYIKDGSRIADVLSLMEAPVSLMEFENARIVREVRGNINRKVNCETSNIRKTANAAAEQIEDVRLIEKTIGLAELPKALDETARIRLQYPTATLQELGEMMETPVGKSGINHRMRKLHAIAEELRKG